MAVSANVTTPHPTTTCYSLSCSCFPVHLLLVLLSNSCVLAATALAASLAVRIIQNSHTGDLYRCPFRTDEHLDQDFEK